MKKIAVTVLLAAVLISAAFVAANGQDDSSISRKLDEIHADQKAMMADIATIKEELRVIKIRITQQQ